MKIDYSYKDGRGLVTVRYKDLTFIGESTCHPDDLDFASENTGLTIAENRAYLEFLKHKKNNEIVPQLNILKRLYTNIQTSKYYNEKSHESRRIRSQIRALENDLAQVNQNINDIKNFIKEYIRIKDKIYRRLRVKNKQ